MRNSRESPPTPRCNVCHRQIRLRTHENPVHPGILPLSLRRFPKISATTKRTVPEETSARDSRCSGQRQRQNQCTITESTKERSREEKSIPSICSRQLSTKCDTTEAKGARSGKKPLFPVSNRWFCPTDQPSNSPR